MGEQYAPNTPSDERDDEDAQKIKIAEDVLKSLVDSVSGVKIVPDASTSLAQDQPQADVVADSNVQQDEDAAADVIGDSSVQQDEIVADDVINAALEDEGVEETNNEDDSTDEDVTILKMVGASKKSGGKSGVGSRLRERKEKMTDVVAEEPKSTKKKKNVAAEATKSPKKKKVAAEATTSTKKKMYGPVRRSSRVEIPA
ncbi:hypothetical protein QL285_045431 [Trifolium repens]|nr:hypothetical protein QL285_045431 [Trifolium repens]